MTSPTLTHLNGVNVDQLMATVNAVQQNPSLARFRFRAHNEWIGGGHFRTTIQSFYGVEQEDTSRSEKRCVARAVGSAVRLRAENLSCTRHDHQRCARND
jgi:hypothetical protein